MILFQWDTVYHFSGTAKNSLSYQNAKSIEVKYLEYFNEANIKKFWYPINQRKEQIDMVYTTDKTKPRGTGEES